MYIRYISIYNDQILIRKIPFHMGLNLIIDETHTESLQETGNNVGKTTVLRLIDYCFGSDGKNIYRDTEFKEKTNATIEHFLLDNNIIIELALTNDLESKFNDIIIKRNFLKYSKKVQEINGSPILNDRDFDLELKRLLFNSDVNKPTFRQIVSKNIRDDKYKISNTVRVLHPATTYEVYEALFFFWFGISTNDAAQKQHLTDLIKEEEKAFLRIKRETNKSELEQTIKVIDQNIIDFEQEKNKLAKGKDSIKGLSSINNKNNRINELITLIGSYDIRKNLIIESSADIKKQYTNIDLSILKSIYESTKCFIPELHKTFEDLLAFHNEMLSNRLTYIKEELPVIESGLTILNSELELLRNDVDELKLEYFESDIMIEYEKIITDLNTNYEQKGKCIEQLNQISKLEESIKNHKDDLDKINQGSFSVDKQFSKQITIFNKYFSKLSKALYGEQFILSYEKNERAYMLNISSVDGNLGTGKKKGQIIAFDFAYINFCKEVKFPYLHFILHDQLENIHSNQMLVLSDLANTNKVQFIVPYLQDKLPKNIDYSKQIIVRLSQDSKLFLL